MTRSRWALACCLVIAACGDDSTGAGGASDAGGGGGGGSTVSTTGSSAGTSTAATSSSGVTSGAGGSEAEICAGSSEPHCVGDVLCTGLPGDEPIPCGDVADGLRCLPLPPICPVCTDPVACIQPEEGGDCMGWCGPGLSCDLTEDGMLPGTCRQAPYECEAPGDDRCLPGDSLGVCAGEVTPRVHPCSNCYDGPVTGPECPPAPASDLGPDCVGCAALWWTEDGVTPPPWRPAVAVLVPAPLDSADPQSFLAWEDALLAPRHTFDETYFLLAPGEAHPGPHDGEVAAALSAAGIAPTQTHTASEFSDPFGHAFIITLVPAEGAPTGSSRDGDDGPIIEADRFPFEVQGDLFQDGALFDPAFDTTYFGDPYLFDGPTPLDGASHILLVAGENASYVPDADPVGTYAYRFTITDAQGDAWVVDVPFEVVPDGG